MPPPVRAATNQACNPVRRLGTPRSSSLCAAAVNGVATKRWLGVHNAKYSDAAWLGASIDHGLGSGRRGVNARHDIAPAESYESPKNNAATPAVSTKPCASTLAHRLRPAIKYADPSTRPENVDSTIPAGPL